MPWRECDTTVFENRVAASLPHGVAVLRASIPGNRPEAIVSTLISGFAVGYAHEICDLFTFFGKDYLQSRFDGGNRL